jgi:hypothetical protein
MAISKIQNIVTVTTHTERRELGVVADVLWLIMTDCGAMVPRMLRSLLDTALTVFRCACERPSWFYGFADRRLGCVESFLSSLFINTLKFANIKSLQILCLNITIWTLRITHDHGQTDQLTACLRFLIIRLSPTSSLALTLSEWRADRTGTAAHSTSTSEANHIADFAAWLNLT